MDPTPADTSRLRALLERSAGDLSSDVLAEALARGEERTAALLVAMLDRELSMPSGSGAPIRAAQLVGALRASGAAAALARCVETVPAGLPLHDAAASSLLRLGPPGTSALLARFGACTTREGRARLAEVLARAPAPDDDLRPAFLRLLEDDPVNGARHLADRGDWSALPHLARALDRLASTPTGDCPICDAEHLTAIASAIHVLGGRLSAAQRARVDDVVRRREALWIPWESPATVASAEPASGRRRIRAERNAPCPCGSGKKYKRCHLAEDERTLDS